MRHPAVVAAAVDGGVRVVPAVRQVLQELQAEVRRTRAERQDFAHAAGQRLVPDRLARGQRDGARVAIPTHAAQRAEVVVERAVFLHQDHDVLDVLNAAAGVVGRNRERLPDTGRRRAHRGGGAGQLGSGTEKTTAAV